MWLFVKESTVAESLKIQNKSKWQHQSDANVNLATFFRLKTGLKPGDLLKYQGVVFFSLINTCRLIKRSMKASKQHHLADLFKVQDESEA